MQRFLTLLLCLISLQASGQGDIKVSVDDFNKDGVIDTLKSFHEGGSAFGGKYVQIINGKTNEIFQLTIFGCFCEIKHTVLIPPELNKTENVPFLETITKQLLPEKRTVPDASLDWIIKSSFSNVRLDSNTFFDLIIDPQTNWVNEEFEYPSNYYLEIEGDTLSQLYDTPYEATKWCNSKEKGYLIYFAHNHYRNKSGDSLKLTDSNSLYKAFHTSHGVFVKKGNFHKWVFLSDVSLTGAPEKLRWESIKMVKLLDKYLIVQQALPPRITYQLFVINIETGICGRLKYGFSKSGNDVVGERGISLIQGESILLNVEGKQLTYKLEDIFKEIEAQYIAKNKRH